MPAGHALHIDDQIAVPKTVFEHSGFRAWVKSDAFPDNVRATFACDLENV